MEEMINWPGGDASYTDSGEGGLFAWMLVPETLSNGEAYGANIYGNYCHVDVAAYLSRPRVMLTRPDVCVSPEGRKVFEPYRHRDSWFDHSMALDKRLDLNVEVDADRRLKRALISTMGQDDISVPMLATVFLGSTGASLYDERQGAYFTAVKENLTPLGLTIYNRFQQAFGVDPVLLTFLDT
jgi:hypothetical protein